MRKQKWVPLAIIVALLLARLWFLCRYAVDSDEPQHLHIVHGWLSGAIPYLDRFDNHTPLFAWLFQPLGMAVGESPDIVLWARLANLPFGLAAIGLLHAIGRRLYDSATALWAVALTLALADWSLKSLEFRPDVLWTALYFLALLLLARRGGAADWRIFFAVGVVLGAALMTSVKTSFLMVALAGAWAAAWCLSEEMRREYSRSKIILCSLGGLAGFAIVPGVFVSWFAAHGALAAMWFNLVDVNQPGSPGARAWWLVAGIPLALLIASKLRPWPRSAIFLTAAFYALLLVGLSPSLKKQTFLPAYPILILAAVGAWRSWRPNGMVAPAAVCAGLFTHQILEARPWLDGMAEQRALLAETLVLTGSGDRLLDLKGETVFRERPVYLAYVLATTRGFEEGRLEEPGPADLARTRTVVVSGDGAGFPTVMRKYLKDHYLPVESGRLRVSGQVLKPSWENGKWIERVHVPIAGEYVIVKNGTLVRAVTVDRPGDQVFDLDGDRSRVLLFWKDAWDRGMRPPVGLEASDG